MSPRGARRCGAWRVLAAALWAGCGNAPSRPPPDLVLATPTAVTPPDLSPPPPASLPENPRAVARAVRGRVEIVDERGRARPVHDGDLLRLEDRLRTGRGGSVTIALGAAVVQVEPESHVALLEVARHLSRVLLGAGRISAEVFEGGGALRVQVPHGDASATTSSGRFSAITDGAGTLAVAAQQGTIRLGARGREVEIGPGLESVAFPGLAPLPPRRIPTSLFLKVGRPPAREQREHQIVLSGSSVPGALVEVNGVAAAADARGHFALPVPLVEGRNRLVVRARDATGRERVASPQRVVVRSKAPPVRSKVEW